MGAPLSPRWDGGSGRPLFASAALPAQHFPRLAARVETLRRQRWTGVRIRKPPTSAGPPLAAFYGAVIYALRDNWNRKFPSSVRTSPSRKYLHIDIKKFARIAKPGHRMTGNPQDETRGAGWEFLYVAVDDHCRMAFTAMLPDETASSSSQFLREAVLHFARFGIVVRRVMTDNGPCFYAHRFAATCREFQLKHIRTRMYTPRTNGKAERFIETAIREWAYARLYQNSAERPLLLTPWTHAYNCTDHTPP